MSVPSNTVAVSADSLANVMQRLALAHDALQELASVPDAGPFANKGACRAFAGYVQQVANRGLAAPPSPEQGQQ